MEKEPKEIFEAYQDDNGWISKEPYEIAEEWEEDPVKRIDLLHQLWYHYHLREKEYEDPDKEKCKWRFID